MKNLILLVFLFLTANTYAATCTSITRVNNSSNAVLTSAKYNTDINTAYTNANAYDGGCINDGSVELAALNATDFDVLLNTLREGCEITKSDAATVSVNKCSLAVNGAYVATSIATTVTWGCGSCASEVASTTYYIYAADGSTGTTLTLIISTTAPNGDGYDVSNNRIIGRFFNDADSDISINMEQWKVNGFEDQRLNKTVYIKDIKAANTAGGTLTGGLAWAPRDLNETSGDTELVSLTANQFTVLATGTYRFRASAPGFAVGGHKIRLVEDPAGTPTTVVTGNSAFSSGTYDGHTYSTLMGQFTVTAGDIFEIQHASVSTKTTDGRGKAVNSGPETYTQIEVTRVE